MIRGRFNEISELVNNNQVISSDSYLATCQNVSNVVYTKRDFLFHGGFWRGTSVTSAIEILRKLGVKDLVVGHSDIATTKTDLLRARLLCGLRTISGVNVHSAGYKLETFPIGVTSYESNSPIHEILSNNNHFIKANERAELCWNYSYEVYASFTQGNNRSVREPLLSLLQNLPAEVKLKVKVDKPDFSDSGRIRFLSRLRSAPMTLCPEGNGMDTHRLWETLYMGGTPVVKSNPKLNHLYRQFPIIILKSWNQLLNEEFMYKSWCELEEFEWDSEKLSISYWARKIRIKAQQNA